MQAARHETTSLEDMASQPIDQQITPPNFGLLLYPGMGFENGADWVRRPDLGATGLEIQFGFWNSAATTYPNTDFSNLTDPGPFIADFLVEGSVENGNLTGTYMNVFGQDVFNEFPSVDYTDVTISNNSAPMLAPAVYPTAFINPDGAYYVPAQVPAHQPVLPCVQQTHQRTTCTRCPRTFSRRSDLPRHMASVHGVGRRAHQCPRTGCGKTYSRSDKVLEHRRKAGH